MKEVKKEITDKKNLKMYWQTGLALTQIITGIGLMMFLTVHLFGTSTINFGRGVFDWYGGHLDHTQWFVKVAVWSVIIAVMAHGLNGLRISLRYFTKAPEIHGFVIKSGYRDSKLWYLFFATGLIMFITVIVHVVMTYFMPTQTAIDTQEVIERLRNNPWYFYMMLFVFLPSVLFHCLYGTRAILIYFGLFTKHLPKIDMILLAIGIALATLGAWNLFLFFRMGG